MRQPVSPIFHGRDIFTPAAAYLSKGIGIKKFGKNLNPKNLTKAPYEEAITKGNEIHAKIISINKFGSLHLNIMHAEWGKFNIKLGYNISLILKNKKSIKLPFMATFGDIEKGKPLIMKDDYGRVEVAINQGSFKKKYNAEIGGDITIIK